MDPASIAILTGILTGAGQAMDSAKAEKMSGKGIEESARQYNEQLKTQRGGFATDVQRKLDESPMRDQLMYNIMQRIGMPMQRFQPRDMFNPQSGPPRAGGINMEQLGQKLQAYRPGAGGVNTDTLQRYLSALGYGPRPEQQPGNDSFGGFFRPFGTDQIIKNPGVGFGQRAQSQEQDRLRGMIPEFRRRFGFGG